MRYHITVNLTIAEDYDDNGFRLNNSMLTYYKQYKLTGDNFSDLAPRIDAVVDAIELVADKDEDTGGSGHPWKGRTSSDG